MELTLLGTGCPAVHAERYGPAQIVRHGNTTLLVDCGSGVTQRMAQAGIKGSEIDAVLLTHMHSDHIVDLFQLVISSWHQGRDKPMRVFGPSGTYRYVDGMVSLWQNEMEQRILHERRPSAVALQTEVIEMTPDEVVEFGAMRVRAVEVDHKPVRHAYGYVFETNEAKLAISGDTRPCDALIEAARGADLLLHEVFVHHAMKAVDGVRTAETIDQVASYHTLSSDVGKVAAKAGVKWLALTHFVPPDCDTDALHKEVSADFSGKITMGEDLMTLNVESGEVKTA
ncbi:MAG: MBL fold metallo-hydrolase [Alphaproteobacteria bacterium]|nr:MBL fold metallo-hydrolase [Alphaproteobacteria bacterium]